MSTKIFKTDEDAFTGLEAAIVLTAFVVVAAVFSYVVLGAGFFTSDTAKQTIHTGVQQATSSVENLGGIVLKEGADGAVGYIVTTVELTAGNSPVDLGADSAAGKLVISYQDNSTYNNSTVWKKGFVGANDGDNVLESNEKAEINITVPKSMLSAAATAVNREFSIELKPSVGAPLLITRTTPPQIDKVMLLD